MLRKTFVLSLYFVPGKTTQLNISCSSSCHFHFLNLPIAGNFMPKIPSMRKRAYAGLLLHLPGMMRRVQPTHVTRYYKVSLGGWGDCGGWGSVVPLMGNPQIVSSS